MAMVLFHVTMNVAEMNFSILTALLAMVSCMFDYRMLCVFLYPARGPHHFLKFVFISQLFYFLFFIYNVTILTIVRVKQPKGTLLNWMVAQVASLIFFFIFSPYFLIYNYYSTKIEFKFHYFSNFIYFFLFYSTFIFLYYFITFIN